MDEHTPKYHLSEEIGNIPNIESNHEVHILLNNSVYQNQHQEEEKVKYFFVPYTDAFEFADITDIISKIHSKKNPFLHIHKVHLINHKKLGISTNFRYGICFKYLENQENVLKYFFKEKLFSIFYEHDVIQHKDYVPIICEKYHTMNDLIRKKGI